MPEAYFLIQAAKYLGCDPWDLAEPGSLLSRPGPHWTEWGLLAKSAENKVANPERKKVNLMALAEAGHVGRVR